jgi:hypothetical protein
VDPGTGKSLIGDVLTSSGGWAGGPAWTRAPASSPSVTDPGFRSEPGPKNSVIAKRWTELVGEMPDVQSFWISGDRGGGFRGGGDDLESITIEIRGPAGEDKDQVVEEIEELLESYDGIADAWNNAGGNRDELLITIRPEGEALGSPSANSPARSAPRFSASRRSGSSATATTSA